MSDLPSFLEQTGPAAYTLTLSASAAETFMLCPAKYAWSRITGIEAATARAGQNYGKAIHLLTGARDSGKPFDAAEIVRAHFEANPQPATNAKGEAEFRTAARALQAFEAYCAWYAHEDWEVLGVEEPFEVVLGTHEAAFYSEKDGCGSITPVIVTVKFRGLRDLRVRWHDAIWVVDRKTTTEWKELVKDEGRASFQFQGYAWVERFASQTLVKAWETEDKLVEVPLIPMRVGGVIGDYIIARPPYKEGRKPTPRDLPRDQFEREPYPYSDAELDEWHADALDLAREIWTKWQEESWPRRRTACAHWGRCEYYSLCWQTEAAYRESAAMGADFRRRTPSPLDEATE